MSFSCPAHPITSAFRRAPRAGVDPIDTPESALAAVFLVMNRPLVEQTIVVFLDDARRGHSMVVVDRTSHPDTVFDVAEMVALVAGHGAPIGGVVIVTIRPGGTIVPGDPDRWIEAAHLLDDAGVELVEWFVLGRDGVSCPRDLFGAPPRSGAGAPGEPPRRER